MNMAKRLLLYLLAFLLFTGGMANAQSSDLSISATEKYNTELELLNTYLRNTPDSEGGIGIRELLEYFKNNGNIGEYSLAFRVYTEVLFLIEEGDFVQAETQVGNLLTNSVFGEFRDYLGDRGVPESRTELESQGLNAIGTVEELANYVKGRKSEANGQYGEAFQYYAKCQFFFDSYDRWKLAGEKTGFASVVTAPAPVELFTRQYDYKRYDGKIEITKYRLKEEELVIPSEIDGYPVTSIGEFAFADCKSLKRIAIPESVQVIRKCAFFGCSALEDVSIPQSVTSIGGGAFSGCDSLLGENLSVGSAFLMDNGILYDRDRTTVIFALCAHNQNNLVLPEGVQTIGEYAFAFCDNLKSVVLPDSVTDLREYAFGYCNELVKVVFPQELTHLGEGAFVCCKSLTEIEIPWGVTSLPNYALGFCGNLSSVTLPETLTNMGDFALIDCDGLKSVRIPERVEVLCKGAFLGCDGLEEVTIPQSVTMMGGGVFSGCSQLRAQNLSVPSSFLLEDGILYDHNRTVVLSCLNAEERTSVELPDGVTAIGEYAFAFCRNLTEVKIPDSVLYVGDYAFESCVALREAVLPPDVRDVGKGVFDGCSLLTAGDEADASAVATLQKGSSGEEVRLLQERLSEKGYLRDVCDGIFGSRTEEAVVRFQRQIGLEATGIATPEVQRRLFADDAPPCEATVPPVVVEKPTETKRTTTPTPTPTATPTSPPPTPHDKTGMPPVPTTPTPTVPRTATPTPTPTPTPAPSWSAWSAWSTTPVSASSTRQVETKVETVQSGTKTTYSYDRFLYYYTPGGYNMSSYGSNWATNQGYSGSWQYITLDYRLSLLGYTDGQPKYGDYWIDGNRFWWHEKANTEPVYGQVVYYRYRDLR